MLMLLKSCNIDLKLGLETEEEEKKVLEESSSSVLPFELDENDLEVGDDSENEDSEQDDLYTGNAL